MVGDVVGDLLLVGVVAEDDDCGYGLLAELLREEEAGDDDSEDDEDEGHGGAGVRVADFGGEPVVRALGDYGEDDGSDDSGEEGLEDEGAENEDGDGEEVEGGLLPRGLCCWRWLWHQCSMNEYEERAASD